MALVAAITKLKVEFYLQISQLVVRLTLKRQNARGHDGSIG